ncbi:MAG: cysteine--tRNA ligase [Nitrospinota bacterium]
MALKIFNSMSGEKEEFVPIKKGKVGMYVCGVTVYDYCHLGHARAAIVFDVIFRYLKHIGYEVTYVRNFTDVDDKIIERANSEGIDSRTLSERFIKEFYTDMNALGISEPSFEPKATENIPEMLLMIQTLIDKGLAYAAEGDVYFAVRRFNRYGTLSKKNMDDLLSGARVEVGTLKRDPLDFALWKSSKPGEPMWDSPWGKGRPGWHIECSAMGKKFLGETFDIHGGGRDLIFPHHENEIAQSFGANDVPPVQYWVHNGFVNINKEKMSKSLGNFFTIRDITKEYDPEIVRYFLLSGHYRSPLDFSDQNLKEAKAVLDRFYDLFEFANTVKAPPKDREDEELYNKFRQSMDDDFNTAQVIGHLNSQMRHLNSIRESVSGGDTSSVTEFFKKIAAMRKIGEVLGIFSHDPEQYLKKERLEHLAEAEISEKWIEEKIEARLLARKERDWKKADAIRDELVAKGISLLDTASGTEWKL